MGWFDSLVEWGDEVYKDTTEWVSDTASDIGDAVSYAADNIGDTIKLVGQSALSAVSSAAGYVVDTALQIPDAAINIVYDYTTRPVINLFLDEENKLGQINLIDFGITADALHGLTRLVDEPDEFLYKQNADGSYKLDDSGEKLPHLDENGEAMRNPRHIILHGIQNTVGRAGRLATDITTGTLGLGADVVVAVSWDGIGRNALNGIRYAWSEARGTEYGGDFGAVGFGTCMKNARDAGYLAWNDPQRAEELAMQGLANASAASIGLVGDIIINTPDIAVNIFYDGPRWVANKFRDDDNQLGYTNIFTWSLSEYMHDNWQFIEPPDEFLYEKKDGKYVLNSFGEKIKLRDPETGEPLRNPNVNAERTILYTVQGIGEIGTFVAVSAATAGVGSALWAARGSATVVRGGVELGRGARMLDGLRSGFNAGARWTSPYVGRVTVATEKTEKAAKLMTAFNKLEDASKATEALSEAAKIAAKAAEAAGETTRAAKSFAEAAAYSDKAARQTVKATGKFNKSVKASQEAREINKVIVARKALGKGAGLSTTRMRIIPEVFGMEAATGVGVVFDRNAGQKRIAETEVAEAMRRATSEESSARLKALRIEIGLDPATGEGGTGGASIKDQVNAIFGNQQPQGLKGNLGHDTIGFSTSGAPLSYTANLAYSGLGAQSMQKYSAAFSEYCMNAGQTAQTLTVP